MATPKNYILSKGERLTGPVEKKSGGGKKNPPYDLESARTRVQQRINFALERFEALPDIACPNDKVVAALTMHPRYISKSDFPSDLLIKAGLKTIGGRATYVVPEKWGVKDHPEGGISDTWFVSMTL